MLIDFQSQFFYMVNSRIFENDLHGHEEENIRCKCLFFRFFHIPKIQPDFFKNFFNELKFIVFYAVCDFWKLKVRILRPYLLLVRISNSSTAARLKILWKKSDDFALSDFLVLDISERRFNSHAGSSRTIFQYSLSFLINRLLNYPHFNFQTCKPDKFSKPSQTDIQISLCY